MAYLDTSVLLPYFCPEPLTQNVSAFLERVENPTISVLVEVEFSSALSKKVRANQLTSQTAQKILALFRTQISSFYFMSIPLRAREFAMAGEWLARFSTPLRTLDALHLALAFSNDQDLITADKALASSAHSLGVKYKLIS